VVREVVNKRMARRVTRAVMDKERTAANPSLLPSASLPPPRRRVILRERMSFSSERASRTVARAG